MLNQPSFGVNLYPVVSVVQCSWSVANGFVVPFAIDIEFFQVIELASLFHFLNAFVHLKETDVAAVVAEFESSIESVVRTEIEGEVTLQLDE